VRLVGNRLRRRWLLLLHRGRRRREVAPVAGGDGHGRGPVEAHVSSVVLVVWRRRRRVRAAGSGVALGRRRMLLLRRRQAVWRASLGRRAEGSSPRRVRAARLGGLVVHLPLYAGVSRGVWVVLRRARWRGWLAVAVVLDGCVRLLVMMAAVVRVCDRMLLRRRERVRERGMFGTARRVGRVLMIWPRALRRVLRGGRLRQRRPRLTVVGSVEARPLLLRLPGIHAGDIFAWKRGRALLMTTEDGGARARERPWTKLLRRARKAAVPWAGGGREGGRGAAVGGAGGCEARKREFARQARERVDARERVCVRVGEREEGRRGGGEEERRRREGS
jgi:hypothetical protein